MKLTERDKDIINYINGVGGATINQIQVLYFPSYVRASVRLKQLADYGFLKCEVHPTVGRIVYYSDKIPSFHNLIANDILIALRGKYIAFKRNARLENCEVDLAVKMNNGKFIIIEIELFNKVTKGKIRKIKENLSHISHDLWIVTKWQSNSKEGRININEIKKISNYY